jgi:hypothetical protein
MTGMFDIMELIKRIIKYLVEGLMVSLVAYAIPKQILNFEEINLIALTAASTFCILDTYLTSMSVAAHTGTAFTIGSNLAGGFGGF